MSIEVEVFSDRDWANQTATRFDNYVSTHASARICLPTGKTMEPFYDSVAQSTSFTGLTIFLLDEFGGLPQGDPGRCVSMINRHLIGHVSGTPMLHLPDIDAGDLEAESRRYQTLIDDGGLDLVLLGLGANGHLGMNEPGSDPDSPTRVVDLASTTTDHAAEYGATAAPTWGLTIGMKSLLAAREVWLMVSGQHKREILGRTLLDPVGSDLPATYLREHPNCTVFADRSAVGA